MEHYAGSIQRFHRIKLCATIGCFTIANFRPTSLKTFVPTFGSWNPVDPQGGRRLNFGQPVTRPTPGRTERNGTVRVSIVDSPDISYTLAIWM